MEPLVVAAQRNRAEEVQGLLQHVELDATVHAALAAAAAGGHAAVVSMLLRHAPELPQEVLDALLLHAVRCRRASVVQELMRDGRACLTVNHNAAIRRAARRGDAAMVAQLLSDARRGDVDPLACCQGLPVAESALGLAAVKGHVDVLVMLLQHERVVAAPHEVDLVFVEAARRGVVTAVAAFVADRPGFGDLNVDRALQVLAADCGTPGCARTMDVLLADMRLTPAGINKALHNAAAYDRSGDIVKRLLSDARSTWGDYLVPAARYGNVNALHAILADSRVTPTDIRQAVDQALAAGHGCVIGPLVRDARLAHFHINDRQVAQAVRLSGCKDAFGLLLRLGMIDVPLHGTYALRVAIECGAMHVLKELLRRGDIDPARNGQEALVWALRTLGHLPFRTLLRDARVNPALASVNVYAVLAAFPAYGDYNIDTLRALLQDGRADPGAGHDKALRVMVQRRDWSASALAAIAADPRVDPSAGLNAAVPQKDARRVAVLLKEVRWRRRRSFLRVAVAGGPHVLLVGADVARGTPVAAGVFARARAHLHKWFCPCSV
jgi:hypothetical protein